MSEPRKNLILVHRGVEYKKDFDEIAHKVHALDPNITIFNLPAQLKTELPVSAWQYPSLTVVLSASFHLPIRRGVILKNQAIDKLRQQEIFRANKIATPPAMTFRFGMTLDPILFGEFVVIKPSDLDLTSKGKNLYLFRRRRAEQIGLHDFPASHPLRQMPESYIVQRFINTGQQPNYYRVACFMGKILCAWQTFLAEKRPDLSAPDSVIENAIVDIKGGRMTRVFMDRPEILALANKVSAAFAHIPLLGIDIIVDTISHKLWVLEVNAGGNTWHFSSIYGKELRQFFGTDAGADAEHAEQLGRQRLIKQFNAFDLAAQALVTKVHHLAQ